MFEYDADASNAAKVLDKYDYLLKEFIDQCLFFGVRDPYDIRDKAISRFEDSEISDAFDNLSIDELMEYLIDKYNVVFDEHIQYSMRRLVFPRNRHKKE